MSSHKVASAFEGCWEVATKMPGRSMMDKAGIALVSAEEMARRAAVAAGAVMALGTNPTAAPYSS